LPDAVFVAKQAMDHRLDRMNKAWTIFTDYTSHSLSHQRSRWQLFANLLYRVIYDDNLLVTSGLQKFHIINLYPGQQCHLEMLWALIHRQNLLRLQQHLILRVPQRRWRVRGERRPGAHGSGSDGPLQRSWESSAGPVRGFLISTYYSVPPILIVDILNFSKRSTISLI
jgi:hypothetical protein